MSASEILLAAGVAGAGVAVGSISIYVYSRNNSARKSSAGISDRADSGKVSVEDGENESTQSAGASVELKVDAQQFSVREQTRTIPKSELEKSKRELRTLLLEKELVSAALTRLYEAEASKEITKSEREILGAKYVAELKALDDKITKMDAFIQIGDLETLRNQLLQLVEQKIDSIERRIESTRMLAEPLIAEMTRQQQLQPPIPLLKQNSSVDESQRGTPIPDISDMLQNEKPEPRIDPTAEKPIVVTTPVAARVDPPKISPPTTSVDRKRPADKVEDLQREILEALDRLERLDVDSA